MCKVKYGLPLENASQNEQPAPLHLEGTPSHLALQKPQPGQASGHEHQLVLRISSQKERPAAEDAVVPECQKSEPSDLGLNFSSHNLGMKSVPLDRGLLQHGNMADMKGCKQLKR